MRRAFRILSLAFLLVALGSVLRLSAFGQEPSEEPQTASEAAASLECEGGDIIHTVYPTYAEDFTTADSQFGALERFLGTAFPGLAAKEFETAAVAGDDAQLVLESSSDAGSDAQEQGPLIASAYLTQHAGDAYRVDSFTGCDSELSNSKAAR